MKFSERIRKNYSTSESKNILVIIIAGGLLLGFVSMFLETMALGGFFGFLFSAMICGGLGWVCVLVIKSSLRKIKSGNLKEYMKTLEPYGDPQMLMDHADSLSDRGLGNVDFRFDDRYMAFAQKRTILIRAMDQIRYFWDYGCGEACRGRYVCVIFKNGETLNFTVGDNENTHRVLQEFRDKSGFSAWLSSPDGKPAAEPFTYTMGKHDSLECDGQELTLTHWKKQRCVSLGELGSCYMYMVSDSEGPDDYYLTLYFRDGTKFDVAVRNDREGFGLYLKLRNFIPDLEYKHPIH